jgi:ribosomal protein L15E
MKKETNTDKPWKRPKPKTSAKTKLTPASKARAKAAAAKAGRPYPNLVDNMNAARQQNARAAKKSPAACDR